jgi:peptidoglycan/xylan/chitin deacetylase (PgdA/CDA1 family)
VTILSLTACKQEARKHGGINISFDDRSVTEWFKLKDVLLKYEVKATFFVAQFDSLNLTEIEMLRQLQTDGHEIASHGALHVMSENYIKENSYKAYLENEIDASVSAMERNGFHPQSFAYPFGSKYWFTDFLLLKKFKVVRGVEPLKSVDVESNDGVFHKFNNNRIVSALSIDKNSGLDSATVRNLLQRANRSKEVVLLYGHAPATQLSDSDYTFDVQFLEFIFSEARRCNLKFYTTSELIN